MVSFSNVIPGTFGKYFPLVSMVTNVNPGMIAFFTVSYSWSELDFLEGTEPNPVSCDLPVQGQNFLNDHVTHKFPTLTTCNNYLGSYKNFMHVCLNPTCLGFNSRYLISLV